MENKIRRLLVKFDALSPADKKEIKALCKEAGIHVNFKSGCSDCYRDAVLLLRDKYNVCIDQRQDTISGRYEFLGKGNEMFFVRGQRYYLTAETPDDIIEEVMKVNPSLYKWKEVPDAEDHQ